ncbi:MAG: hemolysin III family protein [Arenicella sp.]|jgi:hemolysin III|nr:hemolysin III family protein [Arenicella sp.]HAU67502.1 hemolysin III [Gammaproteobacteria bacterium]
MYRGEYFNSISHLVGATLALIGASVLITYASLEGDATKIVGFSVYGVTLFLLYLASTLYHSFSGRVKALFQTFDHIAIYFLIAGTYTPIALLAIEGSAGTWLLVFVWSLAAIGCVLESIPVKVHDAITTTIYLVMGWSCMLAMDSIVAGMSPIAFDLLVTGGVLYTLGVIFYVLDNWYSWCHEVWHVFVLGGSAAHYFTMFML